VKKSHSIRAYLSLSHALLLIISLGAIGFIWSRNEYLVITRGLQDLMRERITLLSNILSHELAEHGEVRLDKADFPIISQEKNLLAVYIDRFGNLYELVPGTVSQSQENLFLQLMADHPVYQEVYTSLVRSEFETTSVYAAAPVLDQDHSVGVVCLLMPLGDLETYLQRLRWFLLGAIITVALLGVGVSTGLTRYFSVQFSKAQELAATVSDGNYHLRIPETGPTELRDLSHYLNVMADKLQRQLKTRQTLLANVAHELARPLAGLQLGIESLRKGAIQNPDLADDLLVSMGQTIRRLEGLIDDVTLAAQPETIPLELHCSAIAVEPFLQGVATRFWSRADSRGLRIEVRVEAEIPHVFADEKRLNQIIGNLLDNAIKFTSNGKTIRLSAERADDSNIRLMVKDEGEGISPEEAEHLFEPFYQGNIGRRIKQGMGLGLSIAQQLTQAHGGSLRLENHPEGGMLAILTLPAANT
jgi:two-component system sensor histidine kinase BaeS